MYLTGTIEQYLNDAASSKPAPGGGSVSALAGALGTAMGSMAANFTVGKKKFADVEPRVKELLASLAKEQAALLQLMDEDVTAYSTVSKAYGMSRETDDQKKERRAAIQKALVVAMDVPLRIIRSCSSVFAVLSELVDIANPNLISDVGVSAILAQAALEGGKLNVEINIASLKDQDLVSITRTEIDTASSDAARQHDEILQKVRAAVNGP